jgi:tetratricopeptide (TPR) repeat protein
VAWHESAILPGEQKWPEALAAVRRARDLLDRGLFATTTPREQADARGADLELVLALEKARLATTTLDARRHRFDTGRAVADYAGAFAAYGIVAGSSDPDDAGARVRGRPEPVREPLIAGLEEWFDLMGRQGDHEHRRWLGQLIEVADPDPWRAHMRQAWSRRDLETLKRLAAHADASQQPAATVLRLALMLKSRGALADAVALLRQAQRHAPDSFWINHTLADCCLELGPAAREDALRFYSAALALRPGNAGAHANVGFALQQKGAWAEAAACYRRAIELEPDAAVAHASLGEVLVHLGDLDGAIAPLGRALALRPDLALAHNLIGCVLHRKGQLGQAIAAHRRAVQEQPGVPLYHTNLGAALYSSHLGKTGPAARALRDEAIASFQKAIAIDDRYVLAHNNLGAALVAKGLPDQAIPHLRQTILLQPDHALAHFNLGRALYRKKQLDEAITSYRTALRYQPNYAPAHNSLGVALQARGDHQGALAAYYLAVSCDPNNALAHCNVGLMLRKRGEYTRALKHLQRGHALGLKRPGWRLPSAQWVQETQRLVEQARRSSARIMPE